MLRFHRQAAAALTVALIGTACSATADTADPASSSSPSTAAADNSQAPTPDTVGIDFTSASGIAGGDPDLNYNALVWQGYWLSRHQFGAVVMGSGLGITFEPDMDMVQAAMAAVAPNPDDPVTPPANPALLQAIYRSGAPDLLNDVTAYEPGDLEAFRLDPSTFEEVVDVRGQAETMLKEEQWARNFADPHFGTPESEFGGQRRFEGVVLNMEAMMKAKYAIDNLRGDDGLYRSSDGDLDYTANWVLVHGLSDVAAVLRGDVAPYYANPDMATMIETAADALVKTLAGRAPVDAREAAAAARALAYRAFTATDDDIAARALERLREMADAIPHGDGVVQAAAAAAASYSAGSALDDDALITQGDALVKDLLDGFDPTTGGFDDVSELSTDDIAWIIAGLNGAAQQGTGAAQRDGAAALLAFHEAAINLSGLQLSTPSGKGGATAGEYERDLPSESYYRPAGNPTPADNGKLTVVGSGVTFDGSRYQLADDRYRSGPAMHLANELNWYGPHLGTVPFPFSTATAVEATGTAADQPAGDDGALDVTIVASNITFDVTEISAAAGQEVTVTFDNRDDGVPHNLHVQGPAGADVKTEITNGPVTQELTFTINGPGTFTFVCDVHPNQMAGSILVSG